MSERERLKDERWELLNSFGRGPFYDGKVRMRIEEIDRRLGTTTTRTVED